METPLLTIDQMHDQYPDQWLLVANTKTDENLELLEGEVIAHALEAANNPRLWGPTTERKNRLESQTDSATPFETPCQNPSAVPVLPRKIESLRPVTSHAKSAIEASAIPRQRSHV